MTMGAGAIYPGENHARVPNEWITKNQGDQNAQFFTEYKDGVDHRRDGTAQIVNMARGIMIRGTATTDGDSAVVRGYLWGEVHQDADDYYLTAGAVHPLRFKRIYANGTTARGIKIIY